MTTFYNQLNALVNASSLYASEINDLETSGTLNVAPPSALSYGAGQFNAITDTIEITLPTLGLYNEFNGSASVGIAATFAGLLAHELGHFKDGFIYNASNYTPSDELTYITAQLISEGKATYNNITIDKQIMADPPTVGNSTLDDIYIPFGSLNGSLSTIVSKIQASGDKADGAVLDLASYYSQLAPGPVNGTSYSNYIQYYAGNLPSGIIPFPNFSPASVTSLTFTNTATTSAPDQIKWINQTASGSMTAILSTYKGLEGLSGDKGGALFSGALITPTSQSSTNAIIGPSTDPGGITTILGGNSTNGLNPFSGYDTNTIHVGTGQEMVYGGYGKNTFIVPATQVATTLDTLVGGPPQLSVSDTASASSNNTFTIDAGENVVVGGQGTNLVNIPTSSNQPHSTVVWGGGGTTHYVISNSDTSVSAEVYVVQLANPTPQFFESLSQNSTFTSYMNQYSANDITFIVDPGPKDTITYNGKLLGAGTYVSDPAEDSQGGYSDTQAHEIEDKNGNYYSEIDSGQNGPSQVIVEQNPNTLVNNLSIEGLLYGQFGITLTGTPITTYPGPGQTTLYYPEFVYPAENLEADQLMTSTFSSDTGTISWSGEFGATADVVPHLSLF